MLKQQIKITVRRAGKNPISMGEFKKLPETKRLASKWFGGIEKLTVTVPKGSIELLEIKEVTN